MEAAVARLSRIREIVICLGCAFSSDDAYIVGV
jgi:hypothetical protein